MLYRSRGPKGHTSTSLQEVSARASTSPNCGPTGAGNHGSRTLQFAHSVVLKACCAIASTCALSSFSNRRFMNWLRGLFAVRHADKLSQHVLVVFEIVDTQPNSVTPFTLIVFRSLKAPLF